MAYMTNDRMSEERVPDFAPYSPPPTRSSSVWRAKWIILLVAVVAAGATYGVSRLIPERYKGTSLVRVTAQPSDAPPSDVVQASNDLASQYAQLVNTPPVIRGAERILHAPAGSLNGKVSAGTVSDQNLISVEGQADTPNAASRRANAIADSFVVRMRRTNRAQADAYTKDLAQRAGQLSKKIESMQSQLSGASAQTASAQGPLLSDLLSQRQDVAASAAQGSAQAQPSVKVFARASGGSVVQPRPVLYAIAAFLVAGFVAAQLAALRGRAR
jgi:capsular polysaccharide biosynthesis protein